MTAPNYVNSGAVSTGVGASAAPALPASLVSGRLLLSSIFVTGGAISFSVGGGWTVGGQLGGAGGCDAAWAWRLVDGSETAPPWTLGFTQWWSEVHQYAGNFSSPIGTRGSGQGVGTTLAVPSLLTTANDSLIAALMFANGNMTIPTPTGYTARDTYTTGSSLLADETQATIGSTTDPVSVSISSTSWSGFLIEILSEAPPPRAFGAAAGVLAGL